MFLSIIKILSVIIFVYYQEGRTIVDKKTQNIIQETRKLQNRRKGMNDNQNQFSDMQSQLQESKTQTKQQQTNQEIQIKASRDVWWQMCNCIFVDYFSQI